MSIELYKIEQIMHQHFFTTREIKKYFVAISLLTLHPSYNERKILDIKI